MDQKTKDVIRGIEAEREALFRKYIEYTDAAERYNRMAYEITCQIESINLALREAMDMGVIESAGEAGDKAISHVPRTIPPEEEWEWDLFWESGAKPPARPERTEGQAGVETGNQETGEFQDDDPGEDGDEE